MQEGARKDLHHEGQKSSDQRQSLDDWIVKKRRELRSRGGSEESLDREGKRKLALGGRDESLDREGKGKLGELGL